MSLDRVGLPRRRRCYLVRHGHVEYFDGQGRPLDPRSVNLSPTGVRQACALGEVLQGTAFDRVLVSDYPRAQQTLERLLNGREAAIESWPQLREIRAGRLREIPLQDLQRTVTGAYLDAAQPHARFLGGERWSDFSQRVMNTFLALLEDDTWESALIVSHDAVNRIILAWAAGTGLSGIRALEQDYGCLNVLDIDSHGQHRYQATLRTLNYTPYDPHKAGIRDSVLEHLYRAIQPSGPCA